MNELNQLCVGTIVIIAASFACAHCGKGMTFGLARDERLEDARYTLRSMGLDIYDTP